MSISFGKGGMSVSSFDYGSVRWKKKRAAILRRDGYLCQNCKRYGKVSEAVEVHHVKPVELWPELAWDSGNMVSLCPKCHRKMHPEKGKKPLGYESPPYSGA